MYIIIYNKLINDIIKKLKNEIKLLQKKILLLYTYK